MFSTFQQALVHYTELIAGGEYASSFLKAGEMQLHLAFVLQIHKLLINKFTLTRGRSLMQIQNRLVRHLMGDLRFRSSLLKRTQFVDGPSELIRPPNTEVGDGRNSPSSGCNAPLSAKVQTSWLVLYRQELSRANAVSVRQLSIVITDSLCQEG